MCGTCDRYQQKLIDFGLNCLSLSPTDIDFITTKKDPAFRTSEKYYDWGVKITVMDCNGEPMAIIKENLLHSFAHTPRAEYVVELPDGQEVARSKQGSFLSDTLMIFNTDEDEDGDGEVSEEEQEAAAEKPPEPLAYARVSKGAKLKGQFCLGGTWRLNINEYATNFWEDPRTREVLMVLTTVKAVRDADRDAEGRVQEARCLCACVCVSLSPRYVPAVCTTVCGVYACGVYACGVYACGVYACGLCLSLSAALNSEP
jgi:hypothetical protein